MRKGKKTSQGQQKRDAKDKKKFQGRSKATQEDKMFLETFKMLNAPISEPLKYYDDYDKTYLFNILSLEWLNQLEDFVSGKSLDPPEGDANHAIIDKFIPEEERFFWNDRFSCNTYLASGCKYGKDYCAVTEAAWDLLVESYPSTSLYWSFEITKKGFVPEQSRLESVSRIGCLRLIFSGLHSVSGPKRGHRKAANV